MKKLLLLSALLICSFGFGQTPITDANFNQAIERAYLFKDLEEYYNSHPKLSDDKKAAMNPLWLP